jgi:hypothetical protein
LFRDTCAPEGLLSGLLARDAGPLDLDAAAQYPVSGSPRLIVIDDVDRGGADAVEMLSVVGAHSVSAPTAVIVTTATPLGRGRSCGWKA